MKMYMTTVLVMAVLLLGVMACGDSRDFEALAREHVETDRANFVAGVVDVAIQNTPALAAINPETLIERVGEIVVFEYRVPADRERSVIVTAKGMASVEQPPVVVTIYGEVPFLLSFGESGDVPVSVAVMVEGVSIDVDTSVSLGN